MSPKIRHKGMSISFCVCKYVLVLFLYIEQGANPMLLKLMTFDKMVANCNARLDNFHIGSTKSR